MSPSVQSTKLPSPPPGGGQFQAPPMVLTPKLNSPRGQYVPTSSSRPSALKDLSLEPEPRSSFVSANSVALLQNARTETPSLLPLEEETYRSKYFKSAMTLLTSLLIGAVFIAVVVIFKTNGILFLTSYLVSILNYEMAWYSYAIIQKLLRPFQLYYEMDVLAPYRDTKKAVTIADAWSARAGIPSLAMALIMAILVMLFCSGVLSILQLYGNLGLAPGMFYTVLPFVASTTFVAVASAMFTPTPMDGAILLLQQIAFSVNAFNSFLNYREPVDGKVRQIILIDASFAMAITFVPIVILRILRSTEVARTGLTLLLDLFFLQYIPAMLMLLSSEIEGMLSVDQIFTEIPQHRAFAVISCFLTFWATDLTSSLLSNAAKWIVVLAGCLASFGCTIVLKFAFAPKEVPLCEWYHFVLLFLGSCLYHVGNTFVIFLRYMAKDCHLHSKWLVRLQYFLLLGFFITIYERVVWPETFNTTIEDSIASTKRMWQRIDSVSYDNFQEQQLQYSFLSVVTRLIETVHRSYTPREMNQMFVRTSHRFLLDVGSCVVGSIQANVTGKECFRKFQ